LEDDGFILWESLAINMYLAETYAGAPLWPAGFKDHACVYQWSLWGANEIEPRIVRIAKCLSKKSPDQSAVTVRLEELCAALRILDDRLHTPYLLARTTHRRGRKPCGGWRQSDLMSRLSGSVRILFAIFP
jgi:glutathione S-transferase